MSYSFDAALEAIITVGQRLDGRGLASATSGNYSVRLVDGRVAITVSGRHKGRLGPNDVMLVDDRGVALGNQRPSAETPLHTSLYRIYPQVNAVLHVHSVAAVALTRHLSGANEIVLEGYEMLKAFPGISTHAVMVRILVYENSQDVAQLAANIEARARAESGAPALLLRGHGAYSWGRDLDEAERIIEALEHLLLCEIEARRLAGGHA